MTEVEVKKPVATVAWMIIFGDAFHNFIDGLSIGMNTKAIKIVTRISRTLAFSSASNMLSFIPNVSGNRCAKA